MGAQARESILAALEVVSLAEMQQIVLANEKKLREDYPIEEEAKTTIIVSSIGNNTMSSPTTSVEKQLATTSPLTETYLSQPGRFDVICAKGKEAREHTGNRRFRVIIEMNLERYKRANSKLAKSAIVSDIIHIVRSSTSPEGGFIKKHQGKWCQASEHHAREKIGQCFRDRLHSEYKSSSKAKIKKRRLEEEEAFVIPPPPSMSFLQNLYPSLLGNSSSTTGESGPTPGADASGPFQREVATKNNEDPRASKEGQV